MLESKGIVYVNVHRHSQYRSIYSIGPTPYYIRFEIVDFGTPELRFEVGCQSQGLHLNQIPWDGGDPRTYIVRNLEEILGIPSEEIKGLDIVGHYGVLPPPPTYQEVLEHGKSLTGMATPIESQQGLIAFSTNIGSGSVHWIQRGDTLDLTMKSGVHDPVMMKILTPSTSKDEVEKDIKRFLKNIYGRQVSL